LENIRQDDMIIPDWFLREIFSNAHTRTYSSKPLKQIPRDNIITGVKQLNKDLAKKMIYPYYFTDRILKKALNMTLNSHHINHANSKKTITPKNLEIEKI